MIYFLDQIRYLATFDQWSLENDDFIKIREKYNVTEQV